jgi:predicted nucleotidyltransferase
MFDSRSDYNIVIGEAQPKTAISACRAIWVVLQSSTMNEQAIAVRREQYRRALSNTVEQIVEALARNPEVERAFLFGSYAQGRCDLRTDLDVLIVMTSSLDFVTRTAEMYRYLSSPVDLDLIVYTPDELERCKDRGFIRQALETGQVIYEKQTI